MKAIKFLVFTVLFPGEIFSQYVEMADRFRSEGKIYIVVATISIIVVGIGIYLFMLEKRLRDLQNRQ